MKNEDIALYNRYRPESFDDVVGNESTIASIKSILARKSKPKVYMFDSFYGTGKTTFGYILAKELGCDGFNIIEIDAGSERSVDDADKLKEILKFKPINGKCRVIILDELQSTSSKYQESLLKSMEKTPNHTYFIMCTTDPQKINKGLISRAVRFTLSRLTIEELVKVIKRVLIKEKVKIGENIIEKIAENADGSARTALTMLEQVIGLKSESDMLEVVERFTVNEKEVIELCRALLNKKSWMEIITILKGIKDDAERVRLAVLGYCDSVLLNPKAPNEKKSGNAQAALIINCFSQPFYSAGKTLLTNACYEVICG
jgi:DNA polymerase-3 subunit gamma/tau